MEKTRPESGRAAREIFTLQSISGIVDNLTANFVEALPVYAHNSPLRNKGS